MSRKRGVTFDEVAKMAGELPGVAVGASYGTPALHVKGEFMARLRDDDPDVLVLKPVEEDEQRFLMETQPDVFFTTDHYRGYPTILIRLSKVDRTHLQSMVEQSWRSLAPKKLRDARDDQASADLRVHPQRTPDARVRSRRAR